MATTCAGARWGSWPSPLGLSLGLLSVVLAQAGLILFHFARLRYSRVRRIQKDHRPYDFLEGVRAHLSSPGGMVMLACYLSVYWMADAMPCSYYSFEGGVRWSVVFGQICSQDFFMFVFHYLEHKGPLGPSFYQFSHKPHHRFVNPRLFDAFNGSVPDTFCMILIPLVITSRIFNANVWEYMLFGSLWSSWLTLIHSEVELPWDPLFNALGLGTAADHHVHHRTFVFNYGHTMMWWDRLAGTYKSPKSVRAFTDESTAAILQGGSNYAVDSPPTEHREPSKLE